MYHVEKTLPFIRPLSCMVMSSDVDVTSVHLREITVNLWSDDYIR